MFNRSVGSIDIINQEIKKKEKILFLLPEFFDKWGALAVNLP